MPSHWASWNGSAVITTSLRRRRSSFQPLYAYSKRSWRHGEAIQGPRPSERPGKRRSRQALRVAPFHNALSKRRWHKYRGGLLRKCRFRVRFTSDVGALARPLANGCAARHIWPPACSQSGLARNGHFETDVYMNQTKNSS